MDVNGKILEDARQLAKRLGTSNESSSAMLLAQELVKELATDAKKQIVEELKRTLVMYEANIEPDSFLDDGCLGEIRDAVIKAENLGEAFLDDIGSNWRLSFHKAFGFCQQAILLLSERWGFGDDVTSMVRFILLELGTYAPYDSVQPLLNFNYNDSNVNSRLLQTCKFDEDIKYDIEDRFDALARPYNAEEAVLHSLWSEYDDAFEENEHGFLLCLAIFLCFNPERVKLLSDAEDLLMILFGLLNGLRTNDAAMRYAVLSEKIKEIEDRVSQGEDQMEEAGALEVKLFGKCESDNGAVSDSEVDLFADAEKISKLIGGMENSSRAAALARQVVNELRNKAIKEKINRFNEFLERFEVDDGMADDGEVDAIWGMVVKAVDEIEKFRKGLILSNNSRGYKVLESFRRPIDLLCTRWAFGDNIISMLRFVTLDFGARLLDWSDYYSALIYDGWHGSFDFGIYMPYYDAMGGRLSGITYQWLDSNGETSDAKAWSELFKDKRVSEFFDDSIYSAVFLCFHPEVLGRTSDIELVLYVLSNSLKRLKELDRDIRYSRLKERITELEKELDDVDKTDRV